jgi:hypothetical protein
VLDLSYDVGVKQYALHLLLMCAFLLAPDARRLADVLILNRGTRAGAFRPFFASGWLNFFLLAFQIIYGSYQNAMFRFTQFKTGIAFLLRVDGDLRRLKVSRNLKSSMGVGITCGSVTNVAEARDYI